MSTGTDAAVDPTVLEALQAAGLDPGPVIGAGMEGVVLALGDDLVAKVWHDRAPADLAPRRAFHDALDRAGPGFGVARVHRLLDVEGRAVSVETRLAGTPLRHGGPSDRVATEGELDAVLAVLTELGRLRGAAHDPDLRAMPVLPGERAFDDRPFATQLTGLVRRRVASSASVLRPRVPDLDATVAAVLEGLDALAPVEPGVVHGDLIPANVLVDGGRVSGVLDFGFLTMVGDPRFDAAVAASVHDMYGEHARATEQRIDAAVVAKLGHEQDVLHLYRAAYALLTATVYDPSGEDGHCAWCVAMLARDDVRRALGL